VNAIVSVIGMILSLFGYGTGLYSQVNAAQAMRRQQQAQVYRQCPPGTTPQIETMPDGNYQIVCAQEQANGGQ
jgi:hypothetical protein